MNGNTVIFRIPQGEREFYYQRGGLFQKYGFTITGLMNAARRVGSRRIEFVTQYYPVLSDSVEYDDWKWRAERDAGGNQRDEDESGYNDTVAAGLERFTR